MVMKLKIIIIINVLIRILLIIHINQLSIVKCLNQSNIIILIIIIVCNEFDDSIYNIELQSASTSDLDSYQHHNPQI